jgi:hypothetical protein
LACALAAEEIRVLASVRYASTAIGFHHVKVAITLRVMKADGS